MRVGPRPHDEDIGDRRVGNPGLAARQDVAAIDFPGADSHASGIGTSLGFGQAKAADPFARRQFRQIGEPLRFRAISVDGVHDEARLHTHHRTITAIDPLHLARDQSV